MNKEKGKLVVMLRNENGYELNNLSPFFVVDYINEIFEKAQEGLTVSTELKKTATTSDAGEIIGIVKNASNPEQAKTGLMQEFGISDITAKYILDMPLSELETIDGRYDFTSEFYVEAVKALEKLVELRTR